MKKFIVISLAIIFVVSCGRTGVEEIGQGIRTESRIVDQSADVGYWGSLAIGSDDIPRISYYDLEHGDLRYAFLNRSTGEWEISTLDSVGDVGMYSSIAVDSLNNPHISYYDSLNDQLKYTYFNGTDWIRMVVYNSRGGEFSSITLDNNDLAHIVFYDTPGKDLYYIRQRADGSFSTNDLIEIDDGTLVFGTGGNLSGKISINLTADTQVPYITYYNASFGALMIAHNDPTDPQAIQQGVGTGWVVSIIDGKPTGNKSDVGKWNSLYLSAPDDIHVCYSDNTLGDLKYSHFDGTTWISETVDRPGIVGESCSVITDHRGNVAIAYYDGSNNDLKFAVKSYGKWQIFVLDTIGIVGDFTSMSSFNRYNLGISYHDMGRKALKFISVLSF